MSPLHCRCAKGSKDGGEREDSNLHLADLESAILPVKLRSQNGGRSGIRTHGGCPTPMVFKTIVLNHSTTLPHGWGSWIRTSELRIQSPLPYRLAIPHYGGRGWSRTNKEISYFSTDLLSAAFTNFATRPYSAVCPAVKRLSALPILYKRRFAHEGLVQERRFELPISNERWFLRPFPMPIRTLLRIIS